MPNYVYIAGVSVDRCLPTTAKFLARSPYARRLFLHDELYVVVDSHIIQRIMILVTEVTTVTQQVSHRPIKSQSRSWSQRGTKKVNGSQHGDNRLLRQTRIQIATKSFPSSTHHEFQVVLHCLPCTYKLFLKHVVQYCLRKI